MPEVIQQYTMAIILIADYNYTYSYNIAPYKFMAGPSNHQGQAVICIAITVVYY